LVFYLNDKINKTLLSPQRRQGEVKEIILEDSIFP